MSKLIRIEGLQDSNVLKSVIAGTKTEIKIATPDEVKTGTDEGALVTAKGAADLVAAPMGCTFNIGTEGTNTILVSMQLTDAAGAALAVSAAVHAYISDDADGSSLVATAPSGGWAITTDGLLIPIVTNKAAILISEADGDIAVTLTETGTKTVYIVVILPSGKLAISGAVTFAA